MALDNKTDVNRSNIGRTEADRTRDTNPDLVTGSPGSHPIGTGVGSAGGAAAGAAAGAAIGSAAAPVVGTAVGALVGGVIGAVGGGAAGHAVAENIDPTAEDAYWRENYKTRPYYSSDSTYDDYAPAYRYGWESRSRYAGRNYNDVESELGRGWEKVKANSRLGWEKAKDATRDAWDHVTARTSDDTTRRC